MNIDGNVNALEQHLEREATAERRYDNFRDEVLDSIADEYEELRERFNKFAKHYDYDVKFEAFVRDEI